MRTRYRPQSNRPRPIFLRKITILSLAACSAAAFAVVVSHALYPDSSTIVTDDWLPLELEIYALATGLEQQPGDTPSSGLTDADAGALLPEPAVSPAASVFLLVPETLETPRIIPGQGDADQPHRVSRSVDATSGDTRRIASEPHVLRIHAANDMLPILTDFSKPEPDAVLDVAGRDPNAQPAAETLFGNRGAIVDIQSLLVTAGYTKPYLVAEQTAVSLQPDGRDMVYTLRKSLAPALEPAEGTDSPVTEAASQIGPAPSRDVILSETAALSRPEGRVPPGQSGSSRTAGAEREDMQPEPVVGSVMRPRSRPVVNLSLPVSRAEPPAEAAVRGTQADRRTSEARSARDRLRISADTVKIVGLFKTPSVAWALLETPEGMIVKATEGTDINGLVVAMIRKDSIRFGANGNNRLFRIGDRIALPAAAQGKRP